MTIVAKMEATAEVIPATRTLTLTDEAVAVDAIRVEKHGAVIEDRVTLTPPRREVLPGMVADLEVTVLMGWFNADDPKVGGVARVVSAYGGTLDSFAFESHDDVADVFARRVRRLSEPNHDDD